MIEISPNTLLQLDRLSKKFGTLTDKALDVGTEAAGKYILRIFRKEIPTFRHVTRKAAYPPTGWQSDKQRRYVMMALKKGWIKSPYKRRSPAGGLAASWRMEGSGRNLRLVNDAPHAELVYGETQARLLNMAGWRKASTTLEEHERQATDAADRQIQKLIDKEIG